jgi:HEPN domain-containing protein
MYKPQVNGFDDETLQDFNPILFSTTFKDEQKRFGSEIEYIKSYLECSKILAEETYKRQKSTNGIKKIFFNYSLVLPTIYMCRHCLELAIKYAIYKLGKEIKYTHGLEEQWNAFMQYLSQDMISDKERTLLKNMGEFIRYINGLDDNGTKLRYPLQDDKSFSQDQFLWVNTKQIVKSTENFVKQMEVFYLW